MFFLWKDVRNLKIIQFPLTEYFLAFNFEIQILEVGFNQQLYFSWISNHSNVCIYCCLYWLQMHTHRAWLIHVYTHIWYKRHDVWCCCLYVCECAFVYGCELIHLYMCCIYRIIMIWIIKYNVFVSRFHILDDKSSFWINIHITQKIVQSCMFFLSIFFFSKYGWSLKARSNHM